MLASELKRGDVVRGRAAGNKKKNNYVIDSIGEQNEDLPEGYLWVFGHNEYSGRNGRFILISDWTVIRSYGA